MARDVSFIRILTIVFTGTIAVQVFALLRQLVIASAFGIDRAMDLYVIVFGVAAVVGFGLGTVMENATLPMLVKRLEEGDHEGFGQIGLRSLIIGVMLGAAACVLFMAAVPLVARYVTTGLTEAERQAMTGLAWSFLPWIMIAVPYYAVASLLKAQGRFRRFMIAEIIVTLISLGVIYAWHPTVKAIAIAYGVGYAVALVSMLPGLGVPLRLNARGSGQSWGVARQIGRFAAVTQMSTVTTLVDRFLASYLPSGAIAATSYSMLITGQASALLSFRDAFMVPLSAEQGRAEKLERMIAGLLMLSIPAAAFLAWHAHAVVSLLLQRGRFDSGAVAMASHILTIQALSIPVGVAMLPMFRTLQIMGRMRFAGYLLLLGAGVTLAVGAFLMFGRGMGLDGYLWSNFASSHVMIVVAYIQLRLAGLRFRLARPTALAVFAALASAAALWVSGRLPLQGPAFVVLLKDAALFGLAYGLCCLAILPQLKRIVSDIRGG
jgi:peptidoglycan biosynthesis protein MviN/MurJ (putative lipid II flippase)